MVNGSPFLSIARERAEAAQQVTGAGRMTGWSRSSPAGRRRRGYLGLGTLAAIGIVLTVAAYSAPAAPTPTLTAKAVPINDQPAYVEAVIDFSGPRLAADQVRASDPDPSDGTADVLVSYPGVAN